MKYALRLFITVFVTASLCLAVAEIAFAQEKENWNMFNRKRTTNAPPPKIQRQVENRNIPVVIGLQNAADPEKREAGRYGKVYYVLFFGAFTVLVVGLVYWQQLRRKQMEWALNNPMALVKELSFVHKLTEQEKRLLQEVSNRNALSSPLQLFVEPKFLLDAWEDDSFVSAQPVVRRLLSKLFDIATEGDENSAMLTGMNSVTQVYTQKM
jgi:hypothetical protein